MPYTVAPPALDAGTASRIAAWCAALAEHCELAEAWRLQGWSAHVATRFGAITTRRLDRTLRVGSAPVASARPVAAEAADVCRTAARLLREDPVDAAPRFAAWALVSLCAARRSEVPAGTELGLLSPDASQAPFEATLATGRALDDATQALTALALAVVPRGGATRRSPWEDLARMVRAAAPIDEDVARTWILGLLEDGPAAPDVASARARPTHRLLGAGAVTAVRDGGAADTADGAVRAAHRAALATPFAVDEAALRDAALDEDARRRLACLGSWYQGLADGRLAPTTEAQRHFVRAARGQAAPIGGHERLWCAYRDAVARLAAAATASDAVVVPHAAPTTPPVERTAPRPVAEASPAAAPVTAPLPLRVSEVPFAAPAAPRPDADPSPARTGGRPHAAPPARASVSTRLLGAAVDRATDEERLELTRALAGHDDASHPLEPSILGWRIGLAGHRGLTAPPRPGGTTYLEMLRDAAEVLGIDPVWWVARESVDGRDLASQDLSLAAPGAARDRDAAVAIHGWIDELETEVLKAVLDLLQPAMGDVARSRFVRDLSARARRHRFDLDDAFTGAGLLVTLHLGGAATYTALATALSLLSADRPELAGRSLASALLCALLGPDGRALLDPRPGWRALDAPARRVVRLVATVAMMRRGASLSTAAPAPSPGIRADRLQVA